MISHDSPAGFEQPSSAHGRLRGHRWQFAAHIALRRCAGILEHGASSASALAWKSPARRATAATSRVVFQVLALDERITRPIRTDETLTSRLQVHFLGIAKVSSNTRHLAHHIRPACWPCVAVDHRSSAWRLAFHNPHVSSASACSLDRASAIQAPGSTGSGAKCSSRASACGSSP